MAYVLSLGAKYPEPIGAIEEAAGRAGRELVETGAISRQAREAVAAPVFPVDGFIVRSNRAWDQCIAAGKWPLVESGEPAEPAESGETGG
jgi:hypothetical protein